MKNEDLKFIQEQIGYEFKNLDLLQQAFIRRSYSQEHGGEDNEVLEFIGDKVLDFIVVKLLSERYGFTLSECDDYDANEEFDEFACEKKESELTEIKKALVQKQNLSTRIEILGLEKFLILGKGDIQKKVYKEDSVKEDLFEAILGAVAIDSNWDMKILQSAVEVMLGPDSILCGDDVDNYVSHIQEWFVKEYGAYPKFNYDNSSYYDEANGFRRANEIRAKIERDNVFQIINVQEYYQTHFKCWLDLSDKRFIGYGTSKSLARKDLCKLIYEHLEDNDLLYSIRDEIDNPNKADAINQLEILARRGYFSIPTYKFEETHDENGNPVWKSTCCITEENQSFSAKSSSKKDSKKSAAFKMLQYVLKD
ncbi:MAG: hypothetical protein IJZ53_02440 [Tyzzerella sp.]|nr:hypothetical protein [Tyzzerella sp.]